jgi:hypothetical protein
VWLRLTVLVLHSIAAIDCTASFDLVHTRSVDCSVRRRAVGGRAAAARVRVAGCGYRRVRGAQRRGIRLPSWCAATGRRRPRLTRTVRESPAGLFTPASLDSSHALRALSLWRSGQLSRGTPSPSVVRRGTPWYAERLPELKVNTAVVYLCGCAVRGCSVQRADSGLRSLDTQDLRCPRPNVGCGERTGVASVVDGFGRPRRSVQRALVSQAGGATLRQR